MSKDGAGYSGRVHKSGRSWAPPRRLPPTVLSRDKGDQVGFIVVRVDDEHPPPRAEDEPKVAPATLESGAKQREVREWLEGDDSYTVEMWRAPASPVRVGKRRALS